jgi:uncharacterized membrane protein
VAKRRNKRKSNPSRRHKTHHEKTAALTPRAKPKSSPLLNVTLVLAGLGVLLTAYLTFTRWFGQIPAYCGAGSDCDLVQASRWSTLLALPLALWGFLMYALLLALLWRLRSRPGMWSRALTLAAFGTGMSAYLTVVSVVEIQATCAYCLASCAIITAIFVILLLSRPANLQRFDWSTWGMSAGAGLMLFLALLHMHYSGVFDPAAGPEKPYLKALAEHLEAGDAKFFGASWCPACQEQKAHFEASAHRLPYVECSPAGRGGPTAVDCVSNQVVHYPTWIIGGRRHEGAMLPKTLAQMSGFEAQETEQ